ncbi:hypothetical protein [Methanospirillum sp.]|uniref:hypothetical protein n=1 Tax=Methanospirillum sp. TaxID=45200 RepID=UPI001BD5300C|nr:hypothetical protein [Methanospirillum sp.]
MIEPSPGCVMWHGKQYLNDPDRYQRYLEAQRFYDTVWDEKPGDSDYHYNHCGKIIRVSGVMLVDRQGRDRPCNEVYQDIKTRIEYLKSRKAPAECIQELERYINVMRLAGDIE